LHKCKYKNKCKTQLTQYNLIAVHGEKACILIKTNGTQKGYAFKTNSFHQTHKRNTHNCIAYIVFNFRAEKYKKEKNIQTQINVRG